MIEKQAKKETAFINMVTFLGTCLGLHCLGCWSSPLLAQVPHLSAPQGSQQVALDILLLLLLLSGLSRHLCSTLGHGQQPHRPPLLPSLHRPLTTSGATCTASLLLTLAPAVALPLRVAWPVCACDLCLPGPHPSKWLTQPQAPLQSREWISIPEE
ncbi:hypothetical protein P7K49_035895 [Saguinus oedipus]|uniref:Uncharacterized protein n=1 Tax=Saguinus oedipus TaxID=9490 RepID=A0ABQ9TPP5_SAGOE|nr:hypothetical protein P7K49_035895 [Saguinus oedipus]